MLDLIVMRGRDVAIGSDGTPTMPKLLLRRVGSSHIVEVAPHSGAAEGVDLERLREALVERHGPAVAVMSEVEGAIQGLILDRRAVGWDPLRDWLESWVQTEGWGYTQWTEPIPTAEALSVLQYHRLGEREDEGEPEDDR